MVEGEFEARMKSPSSRNSGTTATSCATTAPWRRRRATDLPSVPEEGRRAVEAAVRQALTDPERSWLAGLAQTRRRPPRSPLPPQAGGTRQAPGMLGTIFRKAQNKIQDPAKLRRLIVDLIDKENWTWLDSDVKCEAVLHAASADCRDRGCDRSAAGARRSAIRDCLFGAKARCSVAKDRCSLFPGKMPSAAAPGPCASG